jgi:mRNA interferase MazF
VLTSDSALRVLHRVTVAPITSTLREVSSQVALGVSDGMKAPCAVNLHNLMTVRRERVGKLLSTLDAGKLHAVCQALNFALGCR